MHRLYYEAVLLFGDSRYAWHCADRKDTHSFIRQTGGALVSTHCPSRGRRDGLCWESLGRSGRLRCRYRAGVVFYRRSWALSAPRYSEWGRATDVLVDQDDADVFPVVGESVKSRLDGGGVRLAVDNEEILLGVGAGSDMLCLVNVSVYTVSVGILGCTYADACEEQSGHRVLANVSDCSSPRIAIELRDRAWTGRPTSSPMTARNCRSLKSACEAILIIDDGGLGPGVQWSEARLDATLHKREPLTSAVATKRPLPRVLASA